MRTSRGTGTIPLHLVARVRTLMRQMVALITSAATCEACNEALESSIDTLYDALRAFLDENDTLALRIRRKEIAVGDQVVYVPIGRTDAFLHPLYTDGIRKLTFSKDLTREELAAFAATMAAAGQTDPYESDLVTALWERDLANITYEAEDTCLECADEGAIEGMAEGIREAAAAPPGPPDGKPAPFLIAELGLTRGKAMAGDWGGTRDYGRAPGERAAPGENAAPAKKAAPGEKIATGTDAAPVEETVLDEKTASLTEAQIQAFRSRALSEGDSFILEKSGSICLEILESTSREEVFRSAARFLGEICDWLVSVEDYMTACVMISDLRAIAQRPGAPDWTRDAVMSVIRRRGESDRLGEIEPCLETLTDAKVEELFCYLAQMDAVAVDPICRMLAEAGTRRLRYMLARAASIVAKDSPEMLEPYLRDSRWYVARNIAMILGMIASERVLPYLEQVSRHDEARVRREAARALGRVRRPEGLTPLKLLARDENKMIRLAAIAAAAEIGGDAALAFLEDLITDPGFEDRPTDEKRRTMEAYGALGYASVRFLKALAAGENGGLSEKTRACAIYGLAASGTGEARSIISKLTVSGEGPVKYAASEAMAMLAGRVNAPGGD